MMLISISVFNVITGCNEGNSLAVLDAGVSPADIVADQVK
jgi:hypothetical protein